MGQCLSEGHVLSNRNSGVATALVELTESPKPRVPTWPPRSRGSFATRQQPSGEPASFKRHLGLPPLGAIELAVLLDKASADQVVGATPAHAR